MEPREALNRSCQVARYFQSKGYKKGDAVALGKHKNILNEKWTEENNL